MVYYKVFQNRDSAIHGLKEPEVHQTKLQTSGNTMVEHQIWQAVAVIPEPLNQRSRFSWDLPKDGWIAICHSDWLVLFPNSHVKDLSECYQNTVYTDVNLHCLPSIPQRT